MAKKGRVIKRTMEISEMIRLYNEGVSTTEISKLANVSTGYINRMLNKNNVKRRQRGHWKRKYHVNEDYFKTWSNNMAYILGFFVADGFMATNSQKISFAQKEIYILEKIRDELNSNHTIILNNTNVYMLNIYSKKMKDDLENIHNIHSKKSNNVLFPYVPETYLNHFIRGYFDGDGSINYKGYTVCFVGGSYEYMNSLALIFEKRNIKTKLAIKKNICRVYISGRKSIKKFSNWIYQDKGDLYLRRKFNEFERESLHIDELVDRPLISTKGAMKDRKKKFLMALAEHKSIEKACDVIQIQQKTWNNWIKTDEDFRNEFMQIK